ncbi:bifunctional lytic transglycosylase/C40 family peptidase [Streptomyces roseirectus]|uniref:Bifunctional lytic transglycosylase/C40 family peptidase n=1 Tax=Streptomyces roseirectus TaxID=2768066 RepID=A0A7H0IQD8_9ACTN|nr:bifunctional lytic transglycosylase/C40 family peptidase [Streptomyces roseirectus]QNP75004.1 bifunctional lytic transglycosylase/C40 family peptidase [Streptomyces roseirectus]
MGKTVAAALTGLLLIAVLASAGAGGMLSSFGGNRLQPSATALTDIPADYLALYMDAASTCPGLPWTVLAAVGKVESDHGRSALPGVTSGSNHAGAQGPMQFLPSTFRSVVTRHPALGNNPYDPRDAVHAAAAYLCDSGARGGTDIPRAVHAYNHSDAYVSQVLAQAQSYDGGTTFAADSAPSSAALEAINYAQGQLGLPYEWGGDGPGAGDAGFDCSGLTMAAYSAAGITLPRTAQTQYDHGPRLPSGEQLRPGDLVFYGTPSAIHHVGIYIGSGQMINSPRPGAVIRIAPYRYPGDDYAGATRPSWTT